MNPPWVPVEIDPPKPGRYLVAQQNEENKKYRWIRYFDGYEWSNAALDKYGDIFAWTELPPFP